MRTRECFLRGVTCAQCKRNAVCRRQRGVCQAGPPGQLSRPWFMPSTGWGCMVGQQWGLTEESLVLGLRVVCLFQCGGGDSGVPRGLTAGTALTTVRSHLSMFLKILHLSFPRVSWKARAAWWLSSTAVSLYSTASSLPELQRNELVRPG